MKKYLAAIALALTLSACGGSSETTVEQPTVMPEPIIVVEEQHALVCSEQGNCHHDKEKK
jgi:hypothetical protein